MHSKFMAALFVSAAISTAAFAQPANEAAPVAAPAAVQQDAAATAEREAVLPTGTEITLRLASQLTSRDQRVGDEFGLTVAGDVVVDGQVVIPAGTRAVGQVTWRTGRGGFGKSGKMEVAFRYIEMNGVRIPLSGHHRQEGEGRGAATAGAVLGAGIVGGMLVRGSNARMNEGTEFTARTVDALPVRLGSDRLAAIAASYRPTAYSTELGRRRDADTPRRRNCVDEAQRRAGGSPRRQMEIERQCREQRNRTS